MCAVQVRTAERGGHCRASGIPKRRLCSGPLHGLFPGTDHLPPSQTLSGVLHGNFCAALLKLILDLRMCLCQVSLNATCTEGTGESQPAPAESPAESAGPNETFSFTLEDARQLPPCILMSSLPDLTVPWCDCLHSKPLDIDYSHLTLH